MAPRKKRRINPWTSTPPTQPPRETGGDRFVRRYNQRLGRTTGRTIQTSDRSPQNRERLVQRNQAGRRAREISIGLGTSKLPAAAQKSREMWFPQGGTTVDSSIEDNLGAIYDDLTAQFKETQQETEAIAQEYYTGKEMPEIGGVAGVFKDVLDVGSVLPGVPTAEKFAGSPIGRAMDIMSRPAYGVFEGLRNVAEQGYNRADEWEAAHPGQKYENNDVEGIDFLKAFPDALSGIAQGLMGKKKTGFGDVYEEMKNRSATAGARTLRQLEEEHPLAEQTIARGVGALGEFTMDPADKIGLGQVSVLSKPMRKLAETGSEATEVTVRRAATETARKAVEEYYDNVYFPKSGNQHYVIDRATFVDAGVVNALDRVATSELPIRGGGARGSRYTTMNGPLFGHAVAQSVMESTRQIVLKRFQTNTSIFWRKIESGQPLPARSVEALMKNDSDFAEYINRLDDEYVKAGALPAGSSMDQFLAVAANKTRANASPIEKAIRDSYDADLAKVGQDVYGMTRNASYRTLGLRVGNKVIPVKATGRAYNAVAQRLRGNELDKLSNASYERMFPSILSLRAQRARSVGAAAFKDFKGKMQEVAKKYTRDEAKEIHDAIENNIDLSGNAHLQEGKEAVERAYEDMLLDEIAHGVRPEGATKASNYVFIYNRRGTLTKRGEFKTDRKNAIQKGLPNHGNMNMEQARQMGLAPVENAFEAVMYRKLKSQRDITRALYKTDLIENYGFRTHRIGDTALKSRELSKVEFNNLPQHLRDEVKKKGGEYYLPKAHNETAKNFDKLTKWNSSDMGAFVRQWNKVLGIWKSFQTIPNPGFHMTNLVGDTFMGLMDGVGPTDYSKLLTKISLQAAGRKQKYKILGQDFTLTNLWTMYQKDAAGGYFHIDVGNYVKPSTKNVVARTARNVRDTAVDMSEMREDFGRFAHYIHALEEEAEKALKSGKTRDVALEQAENAAVWRVNHYRFDYNALTLWERKMKTVGIPFYTYARKIIPILLESMYQNPKYINLANRFMTYNDGSAADAFSNWEVPEYLRMAGGAFLSNGPEPLFASQSLLPMGNLNMIQPGGTLNPSDPNFWAGQGSLSNTIARMGAPPIQMPFELTAEEEAFSGQQINDVSDYMLNKIPMVEDIRTEGNQIPGVRSLVPGADEAWNPQSMLYNRLFGAGQQIRPVTRGQQSQAHNEWIDRLFDDPMSQFNRSNDIFSVSKTNQAAPGGRQTYRVRSAMQLDESGEPAIVREFASMKEAIAWAQAQIPEGYKKERTHLGLDPQIGTARTYPG